MSKPPDRWYRSQDYLRPMHEGEDDPQIGLELTYDEVLEIFGQEIVERVIEHGPLAIYTEWTEPAASIIRVRERLGLSQEELARKAEVSLADVQDAEDHGLSTSMQIYKKICQVLGIDVRRISFEKFE